MFLRKKSYPLTKLSLRTKSAENISQCDSVNESARTTGVINQVKSTVKHNPYLGFLYTFLTSINFALASVMVKKLSYIDPGQLSLLQNAGVLAGSLPIAVYCTNQILGAKKDRLLLLTRGFLGATSLYLTLTSYRYIPLSEAAIVFSAIPALTTLIARIYLKESCGLVQSVSLVVTICGVLTSVRLPELLSERSASRFDYFYLAGLAAAVGCVVTASFTYAALRKMKDVPFSISMLYSGFLGMVVNAAINATTSTFVSPRCGWDQIMYVSIACLGFLANCTLTLSVQVEAAGIVSVVRSSLDIIVAVVFQIIFFGENPDTYNICGACLVIASLTMTGIRNWLLIQPEESKTRKRLRYFLL